MSDNLKKGGEYKYRSGEVPVKVSFGKKRITSTRENEQEIKHKLDGSTARKPGRATEFDLIYTGPAKEQAAEVTKTTETATPKKKTAVKKAASRKKSQSG